LAVRHVLVGYSGSVCIILCVIPPDCEGSPHGPQEAEKDPQSAQGREAEERSEGRPGHTLGRGASNEQWLQ